MTVLRKFGIELECFHPVDSTVETGPRIARAILGMGYPAKNQRNHFATEYDKWQIKPDSSIGPAGQALEVVSRTMTTPQRGIDEVRKVANWLTNAGFDINTSHGYHIHLDASDMTSFEAAAISYRYNARRAEFNAILPRSRHENQYCGELRDHELDKVRNTVVNLDRHEEWSSGERFTAVNLQHIAKDGSERRIEFRQHSGTLNADKIVGWYMLLCDFVEETLRIIRQPTEAGIAATMARVETTQAVAAVAAEPIVRAQRTRRGATRSVVIGTRREMPVIDAGTDYAYFLDCIAERGVVTQADAAARSWDSTRLRVTAHWLRRNGAALVTTDRNGELAYVGQNGARTREAIFTNAAQIRQRIEVAAPAPAPAPRLNIFDAPVQRRPAQVQTALLERLENADILQNVSPETQLWYRRRREDFASL